MKKKNTALAGALLLVLAGWSAADAAEIYTLDPVIVTAERTDTKELKTPAAASVMVSTNRDGEAEFRINHWGTWLLRTRYDRPAAGELADRVNNEHYFSSITFFVP